MDKKVLITGGTGLIGSKLADYLHSLGYGIKILSRSKQENDRFEYYTWDINRGFIEEGALDVDVIIHLAGAGIADRLWTAGRKRNILESRQKSTAVLAAKLKEHEGPKPIYIGASAIGIYGAMDDHPVKESEISEDESQFLVHVTREWEKAHEELRPLTAHWTVLRIGIVLSLEGGVMKPLLIPFKFRLGNFFGNGSQVMSWIHIDDLLKIIGFTIENQLDGTFNAVAPNPVSGKALVKAIARIKKGRYLVFGVPSVLLKIIFGEMSDAILQSVWASADHILAKGFRFDFEKIEPALQDLL